jgi:GTPase SAR1 family protein
MGLCGFKKLRWLGLNFNQMVGIPGFGLLESLERLYLRGNRLILLPSVPAEFWPHLVELDLHGNQITALPEAFRALLDEKRGLYLDLSNNGSQLSQQFEAAEGIAAKRAALRAFLKDAEKGTQMQRQGKLLLVGEGGVGKSTLLKVLRGQEFDINNDTTHGLELETLTLSKDDGWDGALHCWDFSGQPAMRQTHQLFFTHPALYLLVWNHREAREAETTAELIEWLTMIDQRTEGQGRVLLVVKKAEGREAMPHDYGEILRRFGPQARGGRGGILLDDCCLKVNSVSEEDMVKNSVPEEERQRRHTETAQQVQALRRRIAAYAAQAGNFNEEVPKPWFQAQAHFLAERKTRPYMPWREFRAACTDFGISDPDAYVRTQHRIGTLVWTERLKSGLTVDEVDRDKQLVVLNPDWLSKAIGYVIERDEQRQQRLGAELPASPAGTPGGLVSARQMDAIWRDPPVGRNQPPLHFDEKLFDFFREVMSGYDICREVRHSGGANDQWFLVPNRLPETRPGTWESAWPQSQPEVEVFWRVELRVPTVNGEADEGTALNHWLGRAVFYRLMVMLHEHTLGRQDFKDAAHWRGGLILAPEGGGLARVVFNGSDRADAQRVTGFDLQVAAHAPREVWHVFAHALDYLLRDLRENYDYADIRVVRMVSCPRSLCDRESPQRYYTKDVFLQQMAQSGEEGWKAETNRCNLCNKIMTQGQLWEGRTGSEESSIERFERKLDLQSECLSRVDQKMDAVVANTERLLSQNRGLMLQVHELKVTTGEQLRSMDARLYGDLQSMRETLHAEMRRTLEVLQDGQDDVPRLYTLTPDPKWWFRRRTWRLRLHCERTLLPACLVDAQGKGEFVIKESEGFLDAVAPYLKHVSTGLVAVSGLTALLGSVSLLPLMPVAVAAALEWDKSYNKPLGEISKLIKERGESNVKGLHDTGGRVVEAKGAALLWLQDFIRSQPNYRSKIGLVPDTDGQGRRVWVLPHAKV